MSRLGRRLHRLETRRHGPDESVEVLSERDWHIFHQIAKGELSERPELAFVTEADTDPRTWRDIRRTLAYARHPIRPDLAAAGKGSTGIRSAVEIGPERPDSIAHDKRIEMAIAATRKRIETQSPVA